MPKAKIDHPIDIEFIESVMSYGVHRIVFENLDGTTTFQHIANSRAVFAIGALQAARWIYSKEIGEYSFADFLKKSFNLPKLFYRIHKL